MKRQTKHGHMKVLSLKKSSTQCRSSFFLISFCLSNNIFYLLLLQFLPANQYKLFSDAGRQGEYELFTSFPPRTAASTATASSSLRSTCLRCLRHTTRARQSPEGPASQPVDPLRGDNCHSSSGAFRDTLGDYIRAEHFNSVSWLMKN